MKQFFLRCFWWFNYVTKFMYMLCAGVIVFSHPVITVIGAMILKGSISGGIFMWLISPGSED